MKRFIIQSLAELERFLEDFNTSCFSFDTETTSLDYEEQELLGISVCDGEKAAYITNFLQCKELVMQLFGQAEKGKGKLLIAHNFTFDAKVLHKYDIDLYNAEWFDTMIADHLIDENRKHGLKYLTREILGKEVIEYDEVSKNVNSEEFANYAIDDAVNTWELAQYYKEELKNDSKLFKLFRKVEMPFQRVILEMELNGILVDWNLMKKTTKELKEHLLNLETQLYQVLDEPYELQLSLVGEDSLVKGKYNFNSTQDLTKILFDKLNLQVVEETPGGSPSVGKKTIKHYKQVPFVEKLNQYKIVRKLHDAFFNNYDKYRCSDDRVRPSFRNTGTTTGRLSCTNPNLQQLPKTKEELPIDTRACFIASPGYKMIAGDYSGQELRILAQLSKDVGLVNAFNSGKDFHSETAKMFNVDRTTAKAINFGVAYGKTPVGFAAEWGTTEEEAQQYLDDYFKKFPGVKKAIDDCHSTLRKNYRVQNMAGRYRRFMVAEHGYLPNKAFRQAFNFLIQGAAADMIRIAGVKLLNLKRQHKDWDLRIIASVHDEYVLEVKEAYADEAVVAVKKVMESVGNFCVPIVADVHVGNNYSQVK